MTRLAIAGLIGLGVGVEREWSGRATGPDARFAGIRTFLLLGLFGGAVGVLVAQGHEVLAAAFALGGAVLPAIAYWLAVQRPGASTDGTTEVAGFVVLVLAAIAGMGWLTLAAAAGSVMVLALSEKNRLHELVRHLGETELHAALQFAVLAVVVLPLLPSGPIMGALAIRPRALWTVVLLFSGLNFVGYVARGLVGARRGYGITGAIGGVLSSTALTLNFSRQSRIDAGLGIPLARGVVAACTVLVPRVLVVSALLSPAVALALAPRLLPPFVAGVLVVLFAWRHDADVPASDRKDSRSPLHLASALQMAVAFQVAITAVAFVQSRFGTTELYGAAAVLGLTDVDALTVSMSSPANAIPTDVAARALAIGILANTLLKLTLTIVIGRTTFRRAAAIGLLGLAAASVVGLVVI
jgi:uncharacterized membrane protein (DUF4010 family)